MALTRLQFETEIVFFDIKRTLPLTLSHPTSRYRPHVSTQDPAAGGRIRPENRLGVEFPHQAQEVRLGSSATYIFMPLFPHVDYSALRPGVRFVVLEGDTVVGRGVVISVSDPEGAARCRRNTSDNSITDACGVERCIS